MTAACRKSPNTATPQSSNALRSATGLGRVKTQAPRGAHRIFRRNCGTRESNHAVYITSCTALENYIFLISPKHEFSHSLGQNPNPSSTPAFPLPPAADMPAAFAWSA